MAITTGALKVEIAWTTANPLTVAPTWEDVTTLVALERGVSWSRGRSDETATVSPGSLTLVLRNDDGAFTPGRVASSRYPNVTIGKRVRITAVIAASNYRRFDGVITDLTAGFDANGSFVTVQAADLLKVIGELNPLRSMLEQEYLADAPTSYFTLGEPVGAESWADTYGGDTPYTLTASGTIGAGAGTVTAGTGTGPGFDGLTATVFAQTTTNNGKFLRNVEGRALATSFDGTIECFVNSSTAAVQVIADTDGVNGDVARLSLDATGNLVGRRWAGGLGVTVTSASSITNGATRHVALTWSTTATTTTVTIFIDGANAGSGTYTKVDYGNPNLIRVGGSNIFSPTSVFTGTVAHFATYATALSATRILAHANAGLNGITGELSGTRAARLLGYQIPAGLYNVDAGTSAVGPQAIDGEGALSACQDVARTEAGVVFAAADGRITFHGRARRYGAVAAVTANAETDLGEPVVTFNLNDQFLLNDVTITRNGGASQNSTNAASVTAFGRRRLEYASLDTSDGDALSAASWLAYINGTPYPRITEVTFDPLTTTTAGVDVLIMGLDVSSRVDVSGLPPTAPDTSLELFVEGVSESVSATSWRTTFTVSPIGSSGSVFIFDNATYGRFDTGGVFAF